MLEPIDGFDWSELLSGEDEPEAIPIAILRLSENPPENEAAKICKLLFKELSELDAICQATPFATPYLIDLLREPCAIVTPKVLKLLQGCLSAAWFSAGECEFRIDVDIVEDPEQYRRRIPLDRTQEEVHAWCILVYEDIQNSKEMIQHLADSAVTQISTAAELLLEEMKVTSESWDEY